MAKYGRNYKQQTRDNYGMGNGAVRLSIHADQMFDVDAVKGSFFRTSCAICGNSIWVRASEYPYSRRRGNLVAFLCKGCDALHIRVEGS